MHQFAFTPQTSPLLMRLLAPLQPQLLKGRGREKICRKNSYLGICIIARDTPPTNNQKSFEGVVHLFPRVSVLTWLREGGESDHWISYDWLGQDEEHSKSTAKCRISPICTNMPQTFKMSHELSGYLTLTMMSCLKVNFFAKRRKNILKTFPLLKMIFQLIMTLLTSTKFKIEQIVRKFLCL